MYNEAKFLDCQSFNPGWLKKLKAKAKVGGRKNFFPLHKDIKKQYFTQSIQNRLQIRVA